MKEETKKVTKKVQDVINAFTVSDSFKVDPNGSWTGRPEDKREKPIQDADDL